jgi:P pilus assembly chaperone PapD
MTCVSVKRACLAFAGFLALAGLNPADAANVQPLSLELVSIGANSRSSIQVVNDSAAPMPVEVVFKKLDIGEDGKTTESPAGDEFLVFPPQAVVPAGATQSFRIQWVGAPDIKKSQTYMLSVNQLPVKMKAGESGVQMVFDFGVVVSVAPAGAQSALKLVNAEAATQGKKHGAAITVENPGVMYSYFSDAKLTLQSGSWRKVISPGELRQLVGYGVVLPGKTRRILVPADVPGGADKISASLDYKPKIAK